MTVQKFCVQFSGNMLWWAVLLSLGGCANPRNLHHKMEIAARPRAGVEQTQLAHIGHVVTDEGTFEVATQWRVLSGMLAPRGLPTRLLLFEASGKLMASYTASFSASAEPLWCEGSRVYLHGFGSWNVGDTPTPVDADTRLLENKGRFRSGNLFPDSVTGNVLDFRRGPTNPILTREQRYGSSGGLEDDPWQLRGDRK